MDDFLEIIGGLIAILFSSIFIVLFIIILVVASIFYTNVGSCEVLVNNSQVYNGACKYVNVSSIGENGNTKVVSLQKGFLALITYKQYVSDNVIVK